MGGRLRANPRNSLAVGARYFSAGEHRHLRGHDFRGKIAARRKSATGTITPKIVVDHSSLPAALAATKPAISSRHSAITLLCNVRAVGRTSANTTGKAEVLRRDRS